MRDLMLSCSFLKGQGQTPRTNRGVGQNVPIARASDRRWWHRSVVNASFLRSGEQRQAYFKERAGSDFALHPYLATVGLDIPLHNRRAHPATPWLSAAQPAAP